MFVFVHLTRLYLHLYLNPVWQIGEFDLCQEIITSPMFIVIIFEFTNIFLPLLFDTDWAEALIRILVDGRMETSDLSIP